MNNRDSNSLPDRKPSFFGAGSPFHLFFKFLARPLRGPLVKKNLEGHLIMSSIMCENLMYENCLQVPQNGGLGYSLLKKYYRNFLIKLLSWKPSIFQIPQLSPPSIFDLETWGLFFSEFRCLQKYDEFICYFTTCKKVHRKMSPNFKKNKKNCECFFWEGGINEKDRTSVWCFNMM